MLVKNLQPPCQMLANRFLPQENAKLLGLTLSEVPYSPSFEHENVHSSAWLGQNNFQGPFTGASVTTEWAGVQTGISQALIGVWMMAGTFSGIRQFITNLNVHFKKSLSSFINTWIAMSEASVMMLAHWWCSLVLTNRWSNPCTVAQYHDANNQKMAGESILKMAFCLSYHEGEIMEGKWTSFHIHRWVGNEQDRMDNGRMRI